MKSVRAVSTLVLACTALVLLPAQSGAVAIAPEVERCLAGSDKLSVVLMVDGSQSLRFSDPKNERVSGIKAVLAALARLAEDESVEVESVEVEVLLGSFYGDSKPKPDEGTSQWEALTPETRDDLIDEANKYAGKTTGVNTDYALALDTAKELLDQRSAERSQAGGEVCGLIVFFTDGEFEVTRRDNPTSNLPTEVPYAPGLDLSKLPKDDEEAIAKTQRIARTFLCRDGGLIDQLNRQETVLLTVALANRGDNIDTTLIKEISGRGGTCGTSPSLADYVEGSLGDELLFDFSDSLTGTRSDPERLPPCTGGNCLGGGREFTTLEGESGFELLATTGSSEEGIRFVAPSGEFIKIESGDDSEFEKSGVRFRPLWYSDTAVDLVAEFDTESSEWVGNWNVALNTPDTGSDGALHSLSFQADLRPVLTGGEDLFRGKENRVTLQLEGADGEPLDSSAPTEVVELLRPRADLSGGTSGTQPLVVEGPSPELELSTIVEIPDQETGNQLQIDLSLEFSGSQGRDIDPIQESFVYRVRLPEDRGYPEITTGDLALPSITGAGESAGKIEVRGTAGKDGCIWLDEDRVVNAPGGSEPVRVTTTPKVPSEPRCLEVAEGETKEIEVTITPNGEAKGRLDLDLDFGLRSGTPDVDDRETSTVGVSLQVDKEPNVPARILIFVLLIALGAALPIVLLHLLNRAGATFSAPQGLLSLQRRVEFDQGQIRVLDDMGEAGGELEAGYESFELVSRSGVEKRVREIQVGSLDFRTIASFSNSPRVRSLIEGPLGVVSSSAGRPVVAGSQTPLRTWEGSRWHEVPLDLPGTWIMEVEEIGESSEEDFLSDLEDAETSAVRGSLALFISYGRSPEQGEELLRSAIRRLGDVNWKTISSVQPEGENESGGPLSSLRNKLSRRRSEAGSRGSESEGAPTQEDESTSSGGDDDDWYDDDDW